MQILFAQDSMIRRLVDYVPESEPAGPMLVLEAFTDSLWDARNARPFTTKEIKCIMKGVLLGIFTVHMKGLVYTDWQIAVLLAQLFQAQVDFISPGMYDSIRTGSMTEKRDAIRDQLAVDFDLSSLPFYAEDEQCARILPTPQPETAYMWANTMVDKGISHEDIQLLVEVLHPDPNARLTVHEILESGYLDG
ncbi:hypothetical protein AtubIFM57258_002822 [Aspergillus tubingensis]|nr:hypothetical protein AtubIFM57258_002822 [Aspergillus tubingensis]